MARFLSDEWFRQIGAAEPPTADAPEGPQLILQHQVTAGPEGDVCYHVRVGRGTATVVPGPAPEPDVTFAEDYATAAAIASGDLSAAGALLAGRVRVGGDLAGLVVHQDALRMDDPLPAAVRAATTY